jgi:RNA polymerase sigma factor (sigma-70 family)
MTVCDRIDRIAIVETAEPDEANLRSLLRVAAMLRGRDDPQSLARRRQVWADILERESYVIAQRVATHGFARHGRAAVDEADRGEVVGDVMRRLVRMSEVFEGSEVGQWRKAMGQAIEWTVTSYARDRARRREHEIPVEPGAWDPGSLDPEQRPPVDLTGVIAAGAVGDRIEMIQRLGALGILRERERLVVAMRAAGHSSREVATELDLTPANVDQIHHRALKKLRAASEAGSTDG